MKYKILLIIAVLATRPIYSLSMENSSVIIQDFKISNPSLQFSISSLLYLNINEFTGNIFSLSVPLRNKWRSRYSIFLEGSMEETTQFNSTYTEHDWDAAIYNNFLYYQDLWNTLFVYFGTGPFVRFRYFGFDNQSEPLIEIGLRHILGLEYPIHKYFSLFFEYGLDTNYRFFYDFKTSIDEGYFEVKSAKIDFGLAVYFHRKMNNKKK